MSISLINEAFDRPVCTLDHTPSADNTVDILTKALGGEKHEFHTAGLTVSDERDSDVLTSMGAMTAIAYFKNEAVVTGGVASAEDVLELLARACHSAADDIHNVMSNLLSE